MDDILKSIIWKTFHSAEDFSFLKLAEPFIESVREEILLAGNCKSIEIYSDKSEAINEDNIEISRWKSASLEFFSIKNPSVKSKLPEVNNLLSFIPNVVSATILYLEGNTHLPAHHGYSPFVLRAHLGVSVPEPDKMIIRVGNDKRGWKEGEWTIFDDYFNHEVWHHGTKTRVVLSIDFVKPELEMTPFEVAEHFFDEKEGSNLDDYIRNSAPLDIWKYLLQRGHL